MYEERFVRQQPLSQLHIRVIMEQPEQPLLLAEFFSAGHLPKVGETFNIEPFKEEPRHPGTVRILGIHQHFDIEEGQARPHIVYSVTVEPVL